MTVLVGVELPGSLGQEVAAWAEVEAGWQVVAGDGPPAPLLTLAERPVAGRACVVVVAGTPAPDQVRAALLAGALDVVGWPGERDRLLEAPRRVHRAPVAAAGPLVVPVAGLAGGAGTSTLALAVAGVLAWSGRRTVVVGDEDLLALCGLGGWTGPGAADLAVLDAEAAAAEIPAVTRPVPGLVNLSALGGGATALPGCAGWPADAVVLDLRVPPLTSAAAPHAGWVPGRGAPAAGREGDVDAEPGRRAPAAGWTGAAGVVPIGRARAAGRAGARGAGWADVAGIVVGRADAGLRRPRPLRDAWRTVVVGGGPLDRATVTRLLGGAPHAWLPASDRVARAGVAGRVPSGLPGTFVAAVRTAVLGTPGRSR